MMIDLSGIMGIPFLKKSRFTGSDGELKFVLEKQSGEMVPDGAMDPRPEGDVLTATCWHGPYNSEVTPEEEKKRAYFPFHTDGLKMAQKWLNEQL